MYTHTPRTYDLFARSSAPINRENVILFGVWSAHGWLKGGGGGEGGFWASAPNALHINPDYGDALARAASTTMGYRVPP